MVHVADCRRIVITAGGAVPDAGLGRTGIVHSEDLDIALDGGNEVYHLRLQGSAVDVVEYLLRIALYRLRIGLERCIELLAFTLHQGLGEEGTVVPGPADLVLHRLPQPAVVHGRRLRGTAGDSDIHGNRCGEL